MRTNATHRLMVTAATSPKLQALWEKGSTEAPGGLKSAKSNSRWFKVGGTNQTYNGTQLGNGMKQHVVLSPGALVDVSLIPNGKALFTVYPETGRKIQGLLGAKDAIDALSYVCKPISGEERKPTQTLRSVK
jgi:hypothetical protein